MALIVLGHQLLGHRLKADPLQKKPGELEFEIPKTHRLLQLWEQTIVFVLEVVPQNAPELAAVRFNLVELDQIDPGADGFRFPLDKTWLKRSLPEIPDQVNLGVLHETMLALSNFFSCMETELKARLDYIWNSER